MSRQNLENLVLYSEQRTKINANFTELYEEAKAVNVFEFDTFGIDGVTALRHVGNSLSGNQEFTWTTTNNLRVTTDSITIRDVTNSTDIVTDEANDGSYITTLTVDFDTLKTQQYRISGVDTLNESGVSKDFTIQSAFYFWYGVSINTVLTEIQILALSSNLRNGNSGNFTIPSYSVPSYIYLCFDSSFNDLTDLTIRGLNVLNSFQKLTNVEIEENGITHNVKVYRSNNLLNVSEIGTIVTTG